MQKVEQNMFQNDHFFKEIWHAKYLKRGESYYFQDPYKALELKTNQNLIKVLKSYFEMHIQIDYLCTLAEHLHALSFMPCTFWNKQAIK